MIEEIKTEDLFTQFTEDAATVCHPLGSPSEIPHFYGRELFARPVTIESFSRFHWPVFLDRIDMAALITSLKYQEHSLISSIPIDPKERMFRLPPQMDDFSAAVRTGIRNLESLISLDDVINVHFASSCDLVPWQQSQFARRGHFDGKLKKTEDSFKAVDPDYDASIRMVCGFPFATEFDISRISLDVNPDGNFDGDAVDDSHIPYVCAPESCLSAWAIPQIHRSSRMPSSRAEADIILARIHPDFPKEMKRENGLLRHFIEFHVSRNAPKLTR